jgi:hypothetical protein
LLLALGSLPRPFNNKGIRHGKAGETPSLRGAQRRGKGYSGRNSLIKKEGYDIPASGMDSILDLFSFVGKRFSCLPSNGIHRFPAREW